MLSAQIFIKFSHNMIFRQDKVNKQRFWTILKVNSRFGQTSRISPKFVLFIFENRTVGFKDKLSYYNENVYLKLWKLIQGYPAWATRDHLVPHVVSVTLQPEKLEALRGCRVVEGHVRIVLMERGNETDFDLHALPELREITEYLTLYRVVGLRNVGQIFPNLSVIRGESLFMDYALVIYEMFNLQEVGLSGLTGILRGAVRIEKNPSELTLFLFFLLLFSCKGNKQEIW